MRNNFLEKSHTKCDGETITRPFFEKLKMRSMDLNLWINSLMFYTVYFDCMAY